MQNDPNAETFEIPILRIQDQMARIAYRSRQDQAQERLYNPVTATQAMPVIPERRSHRKVPVRRRGWTARRNEMAMLITACLALMGTGLAWRMSSPLDQTRPAAESRPTPQATTRAPFIGPTIPAPQPTRVVVPVVQASPTKAPRPTHSPTRTRKATTPPPTPTKAAVAPSSPSASPTPSERPSPSTTPSPSPSASPSTASPQPTPIVSIEVGL